MLSSYELYEPHTLQEACELKQLEGAKIVAGGTDIYVAMHNGSLKPAALICTDHMAHHALIRWLITHVSRD